jgi:hypothetical protein
MSNTNTGGPAFPTEYRDDPRQPCAEGMTLRDYFAAKAMQAILQSGGQWGKQTADALHYEDDSNVMSAAMCLAEGSYQMADAMIKVKSGAA